MKIAWVTPLFKSGDPEITTNYRPVSILNQLSKIFERLILVRLIEFLHENKIITKKQYGFLQGLSTKTALVEFHDRLLEDLDQKGTFGLGIFIDLAKAFDTVNHKILIQKLQLYGIQNSASDLLLSYLSNRHQYVPPPNLMRGSTGVYSWASVVPPVY